MGMSGYELIKNEEIQSKIFTIRGVQIMLDKDLSDIYGVDTKILNQAIKRNIERFPQEFRFQLTNTEYESLMSQIATSSNNPNLRSQIVTSSGHGGRRYLPYAFTEQGIAMLSAVLRSETAVKISIQIINAFVAMRKFIITNARIFHRLDVVERKQIEHNLEADEKFKKLFSAIESKEIKPKQGIFYDGQIFDAYLFLSDIFRTADRSIIIIDNYIDDTILTHLTKRKNGVKVTILTKTISNQLKLDIKKFNEQYPLIEIKEFNNSHDRFLIIDETTLYHFGASLKDLGKKWFAFSKMDIGAVEMLAKLEKGKLI